MQKIDYLIIGGGIAGLLCATELNRVGREVIVLDKGRGVGGRMATRRFEGARLDHGAQFFTVRDPRLQCYADEWLAKGVIQEWFRHSPEDTDTAGHPRYCGINGMTDVAKHLAKDLDVRLSEQVAKLSRDGDTWMVETAAGSVFRVKHLVVTAPLPQALLLLDATGLDYAKQQMEDLRSVTYGKGLATLAILDGPSGLTEPGGMKIHSGPLSWIADNSMKKITDVVSAVTLHANHDFAMQNWDTEDAVRGQLMLDAASELLKSDVVEFSCHRWGFTLPVNPLMQSCFYNPEIKLTLAGDAFGGARVEGAALSGLAAATILRS